MEPPQERIKITVDPPRPTEVRLEDIPPGRFRAAEEADAPEPAGDDDTPDTVPLRFKGCL